MIYVPTSHWMNWGWMLDKAWSPLFEGRGDRFWANAHAHHVDPSLDVSRDSGLAHSVLTYGEPDWSFLQPITREDVEREIAKEASVLGRFGKLWTLSHYCADVLASRGLKSEGVLRYPFAVRRRRTWKRRSRTVVVPQRFSIEKLNLVVFHLAKRMRNWSFLLTSPVPWPEADGILKAWIVAGAKEGLDVRYAHCPDRTRFYEVMAKATVCLSTSAYDTFGVAGFEALSLGVPFVAPRMFAFPEFVPDDCLYEPWSLDAMEDAILQAAGKSHVEMPWSLRDSLDDVRQMIASHEGDCPRAAAGEANRLATARARRPDSL
jgi:glycosyltransferase involved in cell wall biosynthesis